MGGWSREGERRGTDEGKVWVIGEGGGIRYSMSQKHFYPTLHVPLP